MRDGVKPVQISSVYSEYIDQRNADDYEIEVEMPHPKQPNFP